MPATYDTTLLTPRNLNILRIELALRQEKLNSNSAQCLAIIEEIRAELEKETGVIATCTNSIGALNKLNQQLAEPMTQEHRTSDASRIALDLIKKTIIPALEYFCVEENEEQTDPELDLIKKTIMPELEYFFVEENEEQTDPENERETLSMLHQAVDSLLAAGNDLSTEKVDEVIQVTRELIDTLKKDLEGIQQESADNKKQHEKTIADLGLESIIKTLTEQTQQENKKPAEQKSSYPGKMFPPPANTSSSPESSDGSLRPHMQKP